MDAKEARDRAGCDRRGDQKRAAEKSGPVSRRPGEREQNDACSTTVQRPLDPQLPLQSGADGCN